MKTILTMLVLALGVQAYAASGAPGTAGGVKPMARTMDANGNPVLFSQDKPWKVFALEYATAGVQVVDERGLAPKVGIIGRICLESAPAIPAAADWAIVWDTITAANMTASGTGRRIAPPFQRVSGVQACTEINAQFTSGLGIMQGAATGSTYVYWR